MRISLIGAGRVATHLAKIIYPQHQIVDIYSRTIEHATVLADSVNAQPCHTIANMRNDVDLVVIAVSDQSISAVIQQLSHHFSDSLIVHTSGSTHLNILSQYYQRVGVFYPLQTFSLDCEVDWKTTPIFVEASHQQDLALLQALASTWSERVYCYDSAQRLSLHLAAVFACNFSNYCYDMAKQVVDAESVDFSLLHPLILATAQKALLNDPAQVQTGPAVRGDHNILNMHQQMLAQADRADLTQVYELLSQGIQNRHTVS